MESEELFGKIIDLLQEKPMFGKILVHRNLVDAHRLGLLQEILTDMEQERLEQSRVQIFQYGSLVGKNDLLARQVFLYLVECLDEQERFRPKPE